MSSPSKRVLTLRVPETVVSRLQQVLSEKDFENNLHYYLWPVHLIIEKQAFNYDNVYNQDKGYIFLHSKNDIERVTTGSKPVLKVLKAAGIIYCKKSSRGNEKYYTKEAGGGLSETKSYAIGESYLLDNVVEYKVTNQRFTKAVNQVQAKNIYKPKPGVEKYLKKAFKSFEINPFARTYCEIKRSLTLLRMAVDKLKTTEHDKLSEHLPHIIEAIEKNGHTVAQVLKELACIASYKQGRYAADLLQIKQFESGEILFLRAPNGKRIFTTANLMPRYLRRFIEHRQGLKLFEADIRNCQPLMLCGLLRKRYRGTWPDDVILYKRLCETGKFYEYLHKAIYGIDLNERDEDERTDFKEELFKRVFYCRVPKSIQNNIIAKIFKQEFPNVYAFVIGYKEKHGYKALSTKMQRVESFIMIDTVCAQLMKSKSPVLTIHDGLIITECETGRTAGLVDEAFGKKEGLNPDIKIKPIELHDIALYNRFSYLAKVGIKH